MKTELTGMKASVIDYFRKDFFMEVVASISLAVGIVVFSAPNNIIGGGVTGIAIILNYITKLPIGFLTFCLNLPLIVLGFWKIGKTFMIKTFRMVVMISFTTDTLTPYLPLYKGNTILASLFAGVFIGLGLGIIMLRGGSTGGTDIIVKLVKKKNPHVQLGSIVFATDLVVILGGSIVFREIEVILLGIICTYAQSEVINRMVKGEDERWMLLSITKNPQNVASAIMSDVDRGATIFRCEGAYSGEEMGMVLSVMESSEIVKAKRAIKDVDPTAFNVVTSAAETLGEGFKSIHNEDN